MADRLTVAYNDDLSESITPIMYVVRGWERGKAKASSLALLSRKGVGREGSIESQQKFDFFLF